MIINKNLAYNKGYDVYIYLNGNSVDIIHKGVKLKPYFKKGTNDRIYPIVNIPTKGEQYAHIIVCYAFKQQEWINFNNKYGFKPVVDHIDNDPNNYHPNNLQYCTQSFNTLKGDKPNIIFKG